MTISRPSVSTTSPPAPAAGPVTPPPLPSPRERTGQPTGAPDDRAQLRQERLAEMVAELTGCAPDGAREAVKANADRSDPLDTVARAMIAVERADDRLRLTGYLRPRPQRRPATRRPAADDRVTGPRPHPSVVAPVPAAELSMSTSADDRSADERSDDLGLDDGWQDDVVLDLRHDTPEVRIDLTMLDRIARVRRQHRRP
jgi:hypothetical protein